MNRLLGERVARHGLLPTTARRPEPAVALTTAIQAQDNVASRLGVRARSCSVLEADVREAIEVRRSVVRTWLLRGTIHMVEARDLRWLVRLFGPNLQRKFRTRWRQLGLSDQVLAHVLRALPQVLADGPLGRRDIRHLLATEGVRYESSDPQAHTHALLYASSVGLICRGPDHGPGGTFTLVDTWLPGAPDGPSGDDALAELGRRYFAAYSPATGADFTTWSGLPSARVIELIRDELTSVDVDGRPGFRLGSVEPAGGVRLLPSFDNYLLGYRDRSAILHPAWHPAVYQGGVIRAVVLEDGAVVGTWALRRATRSVDVSAFGQWRVRTRNEVEAEVEDLARFLGHPLTCAFATVERPPVIT